MTPILIDEKRRWEWLWDRLGGMLWVRPGGRLRASLLAAYEDTMTHDSDIDQ
jgi:hypothetical protein